MVNQMKRTGNSCDLSAMQTYIALESLEEDPRGPVDHQEQWEGK